MPESHETSGPTRRRAFGGSRRGRLLARVGIAVLVFAVLVVIPGYLASRPAFFKRSVPLEAQYASWQSSVHAKVACQRCHVAPGIVSQAGYSAGMLGRFYVTAFSPTTRSAGFARPTIAACESCHADLRTVSPSGDLNIPHRAHVDVLKVACVTCHEFLVHEVSPEGKHTPTMAGCLKCHDGRQAKNACSTCHTQKSAPASHRAADWVVVHPRKQEGGDCASCHAWTKNWCVECHTRRPRSHGTDWRTAHAEKVRIHRNCEACHEGRFCVRCHGAVPQLNLDPAVKLVE